jgi:gliding motility-associated-like protein
MSIRKKFEKREYVFLYLSWITNYSHTVSISRILQQGHCFRYSNSFRISGQFCVRCKWIREKFFQMKLTDRYVQSLQILILLFISSMAGLAQIHQRPHSELRASALPSQSAVVKTPGTSHISHAPVLFKSEQSKRAETKLAPMIGNPGFSWINTVNSSRNKVFIENKGQVADRDGIKGSDVLYSMQDGATEFCFTRKGLVYRIAKMEKVTEREWEEFVEKNTIKEEEEEGPESENPHKLEKSALVEMDWKGANPAVEISSEEMVSNYFNYLTPLKGEKVIGRVRGFKKLIYKNVYPDIDIEYTVHPDAGIKYTFVLHPGADIAQIRMAYIGAALRFDENKNLILPTSMGNITDHAPETFIGSISSGEKIGSGFLSLDENTVGFQLSSGDKRTNEPILIDPWTVGPPISVSEAVDDIAVDGANNVIVYSIDTVMYSNTYISKFNSAGVLQWTFKLNGARAGYTNINQGDVAADPAGNVYVNLGIGVSNPAEYNTIKIDPGGVGLIWGNTTPGSSTSGIYETWTLSFNCDYTQMVQSGGGTYVAPTKRHNNGDWETVNTTTGAESVLYLNDTLGEVISSFWAPNGLVYHMCADSNKNADPIPSNNYTSGAHNTLACVNPATGFSRVFTVHTDYSFKDYDKKAPVSTGINGLVASCAYVYTTDGLKLDQWDALTGAHVNTTTISGGNNVAFNGSLAPTSQVNGGLVVDKCGNVYVGGNKKIFEYDPNLTLINTFAGLPDMVFDLAMGSNGNIYACGGLKDSKSFVAELTAFPCTPPSNLTVAVVQPTCLVPTGTATANPTFCGAPYSYKWLPGLQTSQSISGLAAGTYSVVVKGALLCPTSAGDTVIITINAAPSTVGATITPANISCNAACNGSATVVPSGGNGVYTYSWTGGGGSAATASSLCPNLYTCTIQDGNGCSTTQTANITQPAVISVVPTQSNVGCNGGATGSATATASGGNGGYTYVWSGGTIGGGQGTLTATGLAQGTYTCTITDSKSCTTAPVFTITQPAAPLSITSGQTNINCNGASTGSATATVNGGTSGYTYVWSGGTIGGGQGTATATGLGQGTYTCSITDSKGCPIAPVFSITQPVSPLAITPGQTNVNCNGASTGSATATASGGSPGYTYLWSGGVIGAGQGTLTASGLTSGTYTCTVTDTKGCPSAPVFTITQPASPLSITPGQTNVNCNGASTGTATATANGGSPGYTYVWSGGVIGAGQGTLTASGLASGTYTCTVTDTKGCPSAPVFTITQPASPLSITPGQTNVSCNGANTGTATATANGGTSGYTYVWSGGTIGGGQGTSTATGLAPGTYTCVIKDTKGCILSSSPYTITQPAILSIAPLSTTQTACTSNTGTASVNVSGGNPGYTYTWNPVPGGGQGTASATGLAATTYTLTVKDTKLCSQTYLVTVTSAGGPSASLSSSKNVSCNGTCNGTAKVNATGGSGAYTYSWSSNPSILDSATGLCNGTFTCTISDQNGCKTNQTVTITQPVVLTASPVSVAASCGTSNGSATANASGGTGALSYSWNPSPAGGQGSPNATGLSAGNYTVHVTDAQSCSQQFVIAVNNSGGPSVASIQTNPLCNTSCNGTITVTASGGTGAMTYSWSPVANASNSVAGLCSGIYTCSVRDANNCLITQIDTIKAPAAITVNPVQTNVTCNGLCNGLARATTTGGSPGYSYSWSGNPGVLDSINALCAGNYTCTISDANGCTQQQSFAIAAPAVLSIAPSQTNLSCNAICSGSATATASGGTAAYTWFWATLPSVSATATALCAGSYTCTVTDVNGCSANQTFVITQPVSLTASDSSNASSCQQTNGLASVYPSGGSGTYTYSWSPKGGTAAISTALDSGIYFCTITDAKGCSVSVTDTVKNNGSLPKASVTAGGPNVFCAGGSVTLTASGTGSYSWSTGSVANPIVVSTGGIYTATVTNACGSAAATDTVLVMPKPNPAITGLNKMCAGDVSVLSASGGTTYSWSTGATTDTIHVSNSGVYLVTAKNSCGTVTATDTVAVNSVIAHFTSSVNIGVPPLPVVFTDNSSATVSTWSWTFGDGSTGTGQGATHTYPASGIYTVTLTVTDANNCSSTYTDVIDVKENPSWILVPNVFTPNGDGSNDVFQILSQGISTFDAKIYDRWGVMMSHLWSAAQGWDGRTIAGLPAVNGTYYYIIKARGDDGKSYGLTGFIMLIRSE